jgi:hypothetical protein
LNLLTGSNTYAFTRRNGSKRTALINLKIRPIVRPTILKGRSMSHINGNKNNMINAIGQQITSNKNQRAMAMNVLM